MNARLTSRIGFTLGLSLLVGVGCSGEIDEEVSNTNAHLGVDAQDSVSAITQDVFVSNGNGGLTNPNFQTTPLTAPLFSISGAALGLTWGEFSGASATSAVECNATGQTVA